MYALLSHPVMSWLKIIARENIHAKFVTELVSHAEMSWLNDSAL